MAAGTMTIDGKTHELRDYPYRTEDGVVLPLADGTDLLLRGNLYLTSVRYSLGVEGTASEVVTMVGDGRRRPQGGEYVTGPG
jgi:hypothetical protein